MKILLRIVFLSLSLAAGCGAPQVRKFDDCKGKQNAQQAIEAIESRQIPSFQANGRCRLRFQSDSKRYDERFGIKLWVEPPDNLYLQGDIFFDPKGLVLGTSTDEFWLYVRPEVKTYTWGSWDEQDGSEGLLFNPQLLMEGLGIVRFSNTQLWTLSRQGPFDVLTSDTASGVKKVYIYACDYTVVRIDYFNPEGLLFAYVLLNGYTDVGNAKIASNVTIVSVNSSGTEDVADISISSANAREFTDSQKARLFVRPSIRGFEKVYRLIRGRLIEVIEPTER